MYLKHVVRIGPAKHVECEGKFLYFVEWMDNSMENRVWTNSGVMKPCQLDNELIQGLLNQLPPYVHLMSI